MSEDYEYAINKANKEVTQYINQEVERRCRELFIVVTTENVVNKLESSLKEITKLKRQCEIMIAQLEMIANFKGLLDIDGLARRTLNRVSQLERGEK